MKLHRLLMLLLPLPLMLIHRLGLRESNLQLGAEPEKTSLSLHKPGASSRFPPFSRRALISFEDLDAVSEVGTDKKIYDYSAYHV